MTSVAAVIVPMEKMPNSPHLQFSVIQIGAEFFSPYDVWSILSNILIIPKSVDWNLTKLSFSIFEFLPRGTPKARTIKANVAGYEGRFFKIGVL